MQEPVPDKFTLQPCYSVGVLLHWEALLLIASSLAEEKRDYYRSTFQAPEDAELQEPVPPVKVYPEVFDAHFHLDRFLREMNLPAQGTLDDIVQQVSVDEDKRISLIGPVAIYCDPRTYPSQRFLEAMPLHISVGEGSIQSMPVTVLHGLKTRLDNFKGCRGIHVWFLWRSWSRSFQTSKVPGISD